MSPGHNAFRARLFYSSSSSSSSSLESRMGQILSDWGVVCGVAWRISWGGDGGEVHTLEVRYVPSGHTVPNLCGIAYNNSLKNCCVSLGLHFQYGFIVSG